MLDQGGLILESLVAAAEGEPQRRAQEVLGQAPPGPPAVAAALTATRAEVPRLPASEALTILESVWPPGISCAPPNHRLCAGIGVDDSQEDKISYRRRSGRLVRTGGRARRDRDVLRLGADLTHTVANPRRSLTAALHGGPKDEWDPAPFEERR